MFRGIATVSFSANDVSEAAKWYTKLLAADPFGNTPGIMHNPHYRGIQVQRNPS
ncbi:hypothetical protein [Arthrobacter sp.]|uniref:hypothetical protein n=1 Tax=Arthrobacter sp. TaxID=1667 RepID=UPI0026E03396|nr:hypothetical protein [Arthrobacter sp.]MDO5753386.1 hypothetical protein [Arthrobacter sp.]